MRLAVITYLFFLLNTSFAQTKTSVTYTQNSKITTLLNRHIEECRVKQTTSGYRVQLHFGNDRNKARDVKSKFLNLHQNDAAYESYQQPNFRVRVGDFRTRIEAQKFLKEIKNDFPSAFVVTDEIKFPKLEIEK
jgi:hypothetical protein